MKGMSFSVASLNLLAKSSMQGKIIKLSQLESYEQKKKEKLYFTDWRNSLPWNKPHLLHFGHHTQKQDHANMIKLVSIAQSFTQSTQLPSCFLSSFIEANNPCVEECPSSLRFKLCPLRVAPRKNHNSSY